MPENYRLHEPAGLPAGREGMLAPVRANRTGFPDRRTAVEEMIAGGDTVAVRWSGKGMQSGTFMSVPPSGRRVQVRAISWPRFKDGRLAEEWTEMASLGMPRQITVPAR